MDSPCGNASAVNIRQVKGERGVQSRISIDVANPSDAAAVTEVLEASYPHLMSSAYERGMLERALPLMTRANPKLLSSGTYFIARWDGEMAVGCGGWTPERPGTTEVEPGIGHIRHFATRADHTGRGIGRRIFDRCEAQACAERIAIFECYASVNAVPFYTALGFAAVEEIEVPLAIDIRLRGVRMRRSLQRG